MSTQVVERVIEIAADVFGEPVTALAPTTTPDDLESWDSLAQLNLMMALEDEYSIQFAAGDVEKMGSLEAIAGLVTARSS